MEDLDELLARGKAKSRFTTRVSLGDAVIAEKEQVEFLDPALGGQVRTIVFERRRVCCHKHVLSDANPAVAICGYEGCGAVLCGYSVPIERARFADKEGTFDDLDQPLIRHACRRDCSEPSCGIPVCRRHRVWFCGDYFCRRHAPCRLLRMILGF